MLSGYYTIASGMMTNQKNIDVIGNNMLNSETPGYRAERTVFSAFEMEMMTASDSSGRDVLGNGTGSPISLVDSEKTLFDQASLASTGRSLDLALTGEGFFNVTGDDGTTYLTRNGGFDLDSSGYLVLPGIGRVMGTGGYIKADSSDVSVSSDGTVSSASGKKIGKLLISKPNDYSTLERTESGMFTSSGTLPNASDYQLVQGSLEDSNVDLNVEMTRLVAAQRSFQSCSSALSTVDTLNRKAAQQLAAI